MSALSCLKQKKRQSELDEIVSRLPPNSEILEIGGETGYQASLLTAKGFRVHSIDLPGAIDLGTIYPVLPYDGFQIPFPNASFDAAFSSHVLEHIPHLSDFLGEIHRVLRPGGVAVHVVPSAVWRIWTSLTHYPYLVQRVLGFRKRPLSGSEQYSVGQTVRRRGWKQSILSALVSGPHGVDSNEWIEFYRFSHKAWARLFRSAGFRDVSLSGSGLFYSGYEIFPSLDIPIRRQLARVLGSSSHVIFTRVP